MAFDGGKNENTLYRSRPYLKVGGTENEVYRAVLLLSPSATIQQTLSTVDGYTVGMGYSILNSNLTLTAKSGSTGDDLYCFMLPTGATVDESISWYKPSGAYGTTWANGGGDIEPLMQNVATQGIWNGNRVSFDITPFINLWQSSGKAKLGVSITSTETTNNIVEFHSLESTSSRIGGSPLTNCNFLAAGNSSSISTNGIRVLMSSSGNAVTITAVDTDPNSINVWKSVNACVGIGATVSVFSPDSEQGLVLGNATATVVDKTETQYETSLTVSGISLGGITAYYTTAEFSAVSTLPSETGIIEISSPSPQTVSDVAGLFAGQQIEVNYLPSSTTNNDKTYTVKFTSNETLKNNRVRIYLNETAV